MKLRHSLALLTVSLLALATIGPGCGGDTPAPVAPTTKAAFLQQSPAEKKGLEYLLSKQDKDGMWIPQAGPAITALCVKALIQAGYPLTDPAVKKGLDAIETFRTKEGGYYKDSNPNYNTCVVLNLFGHLPEAAKPDYKDRIEAAQKFLKSLQQIEGKTDSTGKPIDRENPWYGGSGYGEDRPDLSNTAYFVEALRDSGVPANDPAIQKALVYVSRCQMNAETNNMPWAKGATDGGFIYSTANGGESKFGDEDKLSGDSVLRSYGSMTYSGIKSMIYAGLTPDDPRVKTAVKWIKDNWTLDENPGSGGSKDGLFYYYHTFAKCLHLMNEDIITDSKGNKHDWRAELVAQLTSLQNPADGSWRNPKSGRWFEQVPQLATVYAVLALQEARK